MITPVLGMAMTGGAAMAASAGESADTAGAVAAVETGATTNDPAEVADLRNAAADDAARGEARSPVPDAPADASATPSTPAADAPPTAPAEPPTAVTVTPTTSPAPDAGPAFPPVEGCTATLPDDDVDNGELGDSHLCGIGEGHELRPDAAAAFLALVDAHEAATGESIAACMTDSYRSYDDQVELKDEKPYLAAVPGTSNHGWGVAVDLGCGANSFDGSLYAWLDDSAAAYGWENPGWARQDGSKPEPWHWEFDPDLID